MRTFEISRGGGVTEVIDLGDDHPLIPAFDLLAKGQKHLTDENTRLKDDIDRLRRALRFAWMTLGFYATPFNYDKKNWVYHPITGELASGILWDGGDDAREACQIIEELGFKADEIRSWPGPKRETPSS